jgi:acyl-CoA thioesterase-1
MMNVAKGWMKWVLLIVWLGQPVARAAEAPVILVLGDSLSAGYGIAAEQGWVSLLGQRLKAQGFAHRIVNASISGDTTAGGLTRLPAALDKHKPGIVLLELGANDGLRALPVAQMKNNLTRLIALCRQAGAKPVLFEMRIPSNYGPAYTTSFSAAFADVASREKVALVPFFLMPIATDPGHFLDDGIHPNAAAQPALLDAVWPTLKLLLK